VGGRGDRRKDQVGGAWHGGSSVSSESQVMIAWQREKSSRCKGWCCSPRRL
jgi:hypothetical protein